MKLSIDCWSGDLADVPSVNLASVSVPITVGYLQEASLDIRGGGALDVTSGEVVIGAAED